MSDLSTPTPPSGPQGGPRPRPEAPEKKKGNKGLIIVLIIALLGLGGAAVYLYLELQKQKDTTEEQAETIETQTVEIADQKKQLEDLKEQYERIKAERDEMGLKNDSLDKQIAELNVLIADLRKSKNYNYAQRTKLEKEIEEKIAKYEMDLKEKDSQLARLKAANDSLGSVTELMAVEREMMLEDMDVLQKKVDVGSILRAENLRVVSINEKGKEDDSAPFKAKNVDKLRVRFSLGENNVASLDNKEIYLRVVDPSGVVLVDESDGGGTFTLSDGSREKYSMKKEIMFTNTKQEVTFIYRKGSAFAVGNSKIQLYQGGHMIGSTVVSTK